MTTAQQTLFSDPPTPPATSSSPLVECDHCGFEKFIDTVLKHEPHNGQSVRRDCARCKLTMGFPVWYGKVVELQQWPRKKTLGPLTVPSSTVDSNSSLAASPADPGPRPGPPRRGLSRRKTSGQSLT